MSTCYNIAFYSFHQRPAIVSLWFFNASLVVDLLVHGRRGHSILYFGLHLFDGIQRGLLPVFVDLFLVQNVSDDLRVRVEGVGGHSGLPDDRRLLHVLLHPQLLWQVVQEHLGDAETGNGPLDVDGALVYVDSHALDTHLRIDVLQLQHHPQEIDLVDVLESADEGLVPDPVLQDDVAAVQGVIHTLSVQRANVLGQDRTHSSQLELCRFFRLVARCRSRRLNGLLGGRPDHWACVQVLSLFGLQLLN